MTRTGANQLFQNNGNGTFTEVGAAAGATGGSDGYSPSIADYDNDGDLDIFFTNTGQQSILLENLGPYNNRLELRLRGSASNLNGVGAKLTAWMNGRPQAQAIIAGQGYVGTGSDLTAHFGLGGNSFLDSLVVQWPSGAQDKYYHLAANQKLSLFEGNAPVDRTAPTISNITTTAITAVAAQIKWDTDEPSDARVEYGPDSTALVNSVRDTSFAVTHTVSLVNLKKATTYYFRIIAGDRAGNSRTGTKQSFTTLSTVAVAAQRHTPLATPALRNYPNPFRDFTRFEIDLPNAGLMSLKIYDLQGREVATLAEGLRNAGQHSVVWQVQSGTAGPLTSGVYFAVLRYQNDLKFSPGATAAIVEMKQKVFYVK